MTGAVWWDLFWSVFQQAAFWSGMVPLVAVGMAAYLRGIMVPRLYAGIATAFFLSCFWDIQARELAERGIQNWWLAHLWVPMQYGLLIHLLADQRAVKILGVGVMLLMSVYGLSEGLEQTPAGPAHLIGGVVIAFMAFGHPTLGILRRPIMLYVLGTIPALIVFGSLTPGSTAWYVFGFGAYQVVRMVALWWMVACLFPRERRKEADHDSRPGIVDLIGEKRRRSGGDRRSHLVENPHRTASR